MKRRKRFYERIVREYQPKLFYQLINSLSLDFFYYRKYDDQDIGRKISARILGERERKNEG